MIDGGSTDGTLGVLEVYRDKLANRTSEPDDGIYDAMNKGISLATGDIIGFLNADDMYADPDVLQMVVDAFRDASLDACYGDLVYVDPQNTSKVIRYWKSRDYRAGLFRLGWVPPHPTFFVRRNIYERFGMFDLRYHLAADFELMMRFLEKEKVRSMYVPKVLVKMRLGGATNNSLSNIWKQNVEIYQSARQHGIAMSPIVFVFNKLIARAQQFFARPRDAR